MSVIPFGLQSAWKAAFEQGADHSAGASCDMQAIETPACLATIFGLSCYVRECRHRGRARSGRLYTAV
jgi:hypothetical protein